MCPRTFNQVNTITTTTMDNNDKKTYLHVDSPAGRVALSDGVVKILDGIVGVGPGSSVSLLRREVADTLVRLEVILDPHLVVEAGDHATAWKKRKT